MRPFLLCIWIAGALHLLIASANFVAARKFRYREHLSRLPALIRNVFVVQNVFIVLVLAVLAGACFAFAGELAGGSRLGRAVSAFLAGFWGLRLALQLFYYDIETRRRHRRLDAAFLVVFAYLTVVFTAAALS